MNIRKSLTVAVDLTEEDVREAIITFLIGKNVPGISEESSISFSGFPSGETGRLPFYHINAFVKDTIKVE